MLSYLMMEPAEAEPIGATAASPSREVDEVVILEIAP